jgi:hypothetical protein
MACSKNVFRVCNIEFSFEITKPGTKYQSTGSHTYYTKLEIFCKLAMKESVLFCVFLLSLSLSLSLYLFIHILFFIFFFWIRSEFSFRSKDILGEVWEHRSTAEGNRKASQQSPLTVAHVTLDWFLIFFLVPISVSLFPKLSDLSSIPYGPFRIA